MTPKPRSRQIQRPKTTQIGKLGGNSERGKLSKNGKTRLVPGQKGTHEKAGHYYRVEDENGNVVFEGYGRRKHKEQPITIFDSGVPPERRFIPHGRVNKERLAELGKKGVILGRKTYPDLRDPKHLKKRIEPPHE